MINDSGIDFGDLTIEEQIKINQKAYSNYYSSCYNDFEDVDDFTTLSLKNEPPLMYNNWYGTELHKKFVIPLLRKIKLDKIKKAYN